GASCPGRDAVAARAALIGTECRGLPGAAVSRTPAAAAAASRARAPVVASCLRVRHAAEAARASGPTRLSRRGATPGGHGRLLSQRRSQRRRLLARSQRDLARRGRRDLRALPAGARLGPPRALPSPRAR